MRNILSYQYGTIFTGKEITDWCQDQLDNNRGNKKEAKRILAHYGFIDNVLYRSIPVKDYHTGHSENYYNTIGFERLSK